MPGPYPDTVTDESWSSQAHGDGQHHEDYHQQGHQPGQTQGGDDDNAEALSPADGYFHASSASDPASSSRHHYSTSSNVPMVPNVLVEDPSLRQDQDAGAAKAREAEQERLNNPEQAATPQTSSPHSSSSPNGNNNNHQQEQQTSSSSQPYPSLTTASSSGHTSASTPRTPTSPVHHHRRSVDDDHSTHFEPHSTQGRPTERSPLFQQQPVDAPPAYSPPEPSSPQTNPSTGYQTFGAAQSDMGIPEEQQHLLPREPQSMGGPPDGQTPSRWQQIKDKTGSSAIRKRVKTLLGALLIFSIFAAVLGGFTIMPHSHGNTRSPKGPYSPARPDQPGLPKKPSDNEELRWNPQPQCFSDLRSKQAAKFPLSFGSDRNVSIHEYSEDDDRGPANGRMPHLWGEVIYQGTDGGEGSIELEIFSNIQDRGRDVSFDDHSQDLRISIPRRVQWTETNSSPCIQTRITITIPRGASLYNLTAEVVSLDIFLREGFSSRVGGVTKLGTVSGDVSVPAQTADDKKKDLDPYSFGSRRTVVETVSGDVKGWFALYDYLLVHSVSGDIKIDVGPKEVDDDDPAPAELNLKTASGEITVKEPLDNALKSDRPHKEFPPRDYVVKAATASGDIEVEVAMTSLADISSKSGDLRLRLWPILNSKLLSAAGTRTRPMLVTDTKSGDTRVNLVTPLFVGMVDFRHDWSQPVPSPDDGSTGLQPVGDNDPIVIIHPHAAMDAMEQPGPETVDEGDVDMRSVETRDGDKDKDRNEPVFGCLKSRHSSISGDMRLYYPTSWEGYFYAQTVSGSQHIRGEGVELDNRSSFMRLTSGHKGKGTSDMQLNSVSGDQYLTIGEAK